MFIIKNNTPWNEYTNAGIITEKGNSKEFKTGDWRTRRPVWIEENCKQCSLCWPTCPEDCIPLNKDKKIRKDFDYDYCKGCGICAKVCPFSAIIMEDEVYEN